MGNNIKKGALYIVATPIGNLEDITLRAIRVLKEVGEHYSGRGYARRTRKLLGAYQISTPMSTLYDRIEGAKSSILISKMKLRVSM